ncbi:protein TsetseEP [Cloeon dipterum]|uniref:protein TsetseEP n=1 Tax=Cloeon dipterum TaxID=197152 RepID=UPI00321F82B0
MSTASTIPASTHSTTSHTEDNNVNIATGHEQIQLARLPEPLPASQPRPEPQPLPAIDEETEPTVGVDPPSANTCSPYVLTFVEEEQGLKQIPQPLLAMQPIPEPPPFPEPQPLSEQQPTSEPQPLSDQQPIAEPQPLPEQQPIAEPQPLPEPLPPPAVESEDETVPKVLADPPSANIHSPYVLNFDVEGQEEEPNPPFVPRHSMRLKAKKTLPK